MDYKAKYEELRSKIQNLHDRLTGELRQVIEEEVPETIESEDERIRKEIIYHIQHCDDTIDEVAEKRMIAWLEKQGEQQPAETVNWSPQEESCICQLESLVKEQWRQAEKVHNSVDIKKMSELMFFLKTLNPSKKLQGKSALEAAKQEKVDNQNCVKPVDKVEPKFNVGDSMRTLQEAKDGWTKGIPVVVSIDEEYYHCNNELIAIKDQDDYEYPPMNRKHDSCGSCVEQKSADKVEPKFKIKDWVLWDNKISCHVDNIYQGKESLMYTITDTNNMIRSYSVKGFDNNAHLWSIKDAKEGDVLVASDGSIFLFKGTIDGACKHYVALTTYSVVKFNEGLEHYWETSTAVHPATKEQREQLEKAMADAGYVFDFEKKELKKIEYNITNEYIETKGLSEIEAVELTKETSDEKHNLTDFERTLADICIGWIGEEPGWEQYIKDNADVLLKIAIKKFNSIQDVPFEPKPAWSEEELGSITAAINNLEYLKNNYVYHPMGLKPAITFLKSLKDRVQPQPKQEWSEEDEKIIKRIDSLLYAINRSEFEDIHAWLKSLKPQSRWKPSEKQVKLLGEVQQALLGKDCHNRFVNFMHELKRLREE